MLALLLAIIIYKTKQWRRLCHCSCLGRFIFVIELLHSYERISI